MILAAGLGTRLRPLTDFRAKPALPVRGRPVISLLLEFLSRHGVREVLINLHYRPQTIRDAVESDHPKDMKISWSEEPIPLGTGGGIRRAASFLAGTRDCVVLAGDMLLDLDLSDLLARHRAACRDQARDVTLVLRDDPRGDRFGTIGIGASNGVTRIGQRALVGAARDAGPETRRGLFTGVRFFSREALTGFPDQTRDHTTGPSGDAVGADTDFPFEDLRDWLAPRFEAGRCRVGAELVDPSESVWEPVGTPDEYLEVNLRPPVLPSLGPDVAAWSGDLREPGSADSSVVARSAEVPQDVVLERCVVWDHEALPAGFHGRDGVYAGNSFHPCRESASRSPQ